MKFTKLTATSAKVSAISSIPLLKDMLMDNGSFGSDDSNYSIDTPMGSIKFKLTWEANSVGIEIKRKPVFVTNAFILDELAKRVVDL